MNSSDAILTSEITVGLRACKMTVIFNRLLSTLIACKTCAVCRIIAGGTRSGCVWLGTDQGSVSPVQLCETQHQANIKPFIRNILSLGLQGCKNSLDLSSTYANQQTHQPLSATPLTPHASLASPEPASVKHSLTPSRSRLSEIEPAKSTAIPSHQPNSGARLQHSSAAGHSLPVDLRRVSPFATVRRPSDTNRYFPESTSARSRARGHCSTHTTIRANLRVWQLSIFPALPGSLFWSGKPSASAMSSKLMWACARRACAPHPGCQGSGGD